MNTYKLVIFDMDGTILDTINDISTAVNNTLAKWEYPIKTVEQVKYAVGNGLRLTLIRSLPEDICNSILNGKYDIADMSEAKFEEMFTYMLNEYELHSSDTTKPYDGIVDLLVKLREKGIKTAVVSNKKDFAVKSLCKKFFDGLFDFSLGEVDGIRKKPDSAPIEYVLNKLYIKSSESIYIGDSDVDILTATNSGLDSIIVTWGFRERDFLISHGAKKLAGTPEELLTQLI